MTKSQVYNKEDGCPFCKNKDIRRISKPVDSDLICVKCGAVFYSLNHQDNELQGMFTGRTEPVDKENSYIDKRIKT